jgi:ribosomal protein L13E
MTTQPQMLPNVTDENDAHLHSSPSGSQLPPPHHHVLNDDPPFSLEELAQAGFTAEELKEAGFELSRLKAVGFSFKQLKNAGFDAAAFKNDGHDATELKNAGFTAEELKDAGFEFSTLKAVGFHVAALRVAGFNAATFKKNGCGLAELRKAGFTAKQLALGLHSKEDELTSYHHQQINELNESRVRSGRIFGQTWQEFLGFFAPFGTKNSFWQRLCASPMLRHVFIHDSKFIEDFGHHTLADEAPSPHITTSDVDSAVNTCALICALLIGIPSGVISNMGSSDFYTSIIVSGWGNRKSDCSADDMSNFTSECSHSFQEIFSSLTAFVLISFYSNIFVLLVAVLYYMCRPAESCNVSSTLTLLEAFTMEVRHKIRKARHPTGPESEKSPSEPFENPALESEVFFKASFLAQNEAEEQKNQVSPRRLFLFAHSFAHLLKATSLNLTQLCMSEATATIRMPMFYITSRRPHESTSSRPMQEFYMWYKSKSAVFIR